MGKFSPKIPKTSPPAPPDLNPAEARSYKKEFVFDDVDEVNAPIIKKIQALKSPYLDYLLKIHHPDFYIIHCPERTSNNVLEDSFIFTLYVGLFYVLILENVNPGRATLLMYNKIDDVSDGRIYNEHIAKLKSFFKGHSKNKRSGLLEGLYNPSTLYLFKYYRIFHPSFNEWKADLSRLKIEPGIRLPRLQRSPTFRSNYNLNNSLVKQEQDSNTLDLDNLNGNEILNKINGKTIYIMSSRQLSRWKVLLRKLETEFNLTYVFSVTDEFQGVISLSDINELGYFDNRILKNKINEQSLDIYKISRLEQYLNNRHKK